MTATLVRHGDGWALPLDAETLANAGIDVGGSLRIRVENGSVVIAPEPCTVDPAFVAALGEANTSYPQTLRKLAE